MHRADQEIYEVSRRIDQSDASAGVERGGSAEDRPNAWLRSRPACRVEKGGNRCVVTEATETAARRRHGTPVSVAAAGHHVYGAAMRFATLDRLPLWGDEALTYRVIGSFDDMMRFFASTGSRASLLHLLLMQHGMPVGSSRWA
jgi:hypothetical protein